jgi:hypothetical protein
VSGVGAIARIAWGRTNKGVHMCASESVHDELRKQMCALIESMFTLMSVGESQGSTKQGVHIVTGGQD